MNKVVTVIGKIAPSIAGALGGPLASSAVSLVTKALGISESSGEDEIVNAVANATPDQVLALKKADLDYKLATLQAAYADTANARAREIAVRDNTPRYLAYSVLAYCASIHLYVIIMHLVDSPVTARILTTVDAALLLVLGFYFGSMHKENNEK